MKSTIDKVRDVSFYIAIIAIFLCIGYLIGDNDGYKKGYKHGYSKGNYDGTVETYKKCIEEVRAIY